VKTNEEQMNEESLAEDAKEKKQTEAEKTDIGKQGKMNTGYNVPLSPVDWRRPDGRTPRRIRPAIPTHLSEEGARDAYYQNVMQYSAYRGIPIECVV